MKKSKQRLLRVPDIIKRTDEQHPIPAFAVRRNNGELAELQIFPAPEKTVPEDCISENEKATAAWTFRNNKRSGATTNTLSASKCLYLAVRVNDSVYGVFGIVIDKVPLDSFENSVVLSIIGELALENLRNIKEKEDAAVLAKNEQLRANLLRYISHDLRTPLTSISGNAGILAAESDIIDPEKRTKIYKSIYDDSLWLINLVENLLSVTRIEDGAMKIRRRYELMEEVIGEAVSRIRKTSGRKITVHQEDELLMVNIPVVEDDSAVRNLITTTLETHDYKYIKAANGQTALMEASTHNPDIILLDSGLPDIDGIEVIMRIRTWSQVPIIVISARSEDADKIDALDSGADDYLTKPFSVEELLAR